MINLLLCGNKKVFDGALTQLISMTKRTQETINCYILTMDLSRLKPEYVCITDEQVEFLNEVIKSKNPQNDGTCSNSFVLKNNKCYRKVRKSYFNSVKLYTEDLK